MQDDKETALTKSIQLLKLGRFQFLGAGFILFSMGSLFANHQGSSFSLFDFVYGYSIYFCAHLSVSYSNDYFDQSADVNTQSTMFTGGSGVLQKNPELAPLAKTIALTLLSLSLILTAIGIAFFHLPAILIPIVGAGNFLGWFYTAPPIKLAYRGLGEISTIFTIGILSPAMGFCIMTGTLNLDFLIFFTPLLPIGLFFMLNVQLPDRVGDLHSGKKTLVVRIGGHRSFMLVGACAIATALLYLIYAIIDPYQSISFWAIAGLSLVFVVPGSISAFFHPNDWNEVTRYVSINLATLVLFMLLSAGLLFLPLLHA